MSRPPATPIPPLPTRRRRPGISSTPASSATGENGPRRHKRRYPDRMPQTVELPRVGGPGSGLGGHWRVIVLNDDHNTFDHVAESLARFIPGVTLAEGYRFADRIHSNG